MEETSNPLTLEELAETVRTLQAQLLATVELSTKKTETIEELLELVKTQNDDLSMVKGMAHQLQGKLNDLESRYYANVGSSSIPLSDGSYYNIAEAIRKIDQKISIESSQQYEMERTFSILMETARALFKALPEDCRAEALSNMASGKFVASIPKYIRYPVPFDQLLKEAALLLDQPESILTLYK